MNARMLAAILAISLAGGSAFGDDERQTEQPTTPSLECPSAEMSCEMLMNGSWNSYRVTGENVVGINPRSVTIRSIRGKDGTELLKRTNGASDSMPCQDVCARVNPDGKTCYFNTDDDPTMAANAEDLVIKGSAIVLLGATLKEQTAEIDLNDPNEKTVGPFSVRAWRVEKCMPIGWQDDPPRLAMLLESMLSDLADAFAEFIEPYEEYFAQDLESQRDSQAENSESSSDDADHFISTIAFDIYASPTGGVRVEAVDAGRGDAQIQLVGPISRLKDIQVSNHGQEIKTLHRGTRFRGSYTCDDSATRICDIPKPEDGKITVTLQYWADVNETKTRFATNPKKRELVIMK